MGSWLYGVRSTARVVTTRGRVKWSIYRLPLMVDSLRAQCPQLPFKWDHTRGKDVAKKSRRLFVLSCVWFFFFFFLEVDTAIYYFFLIAESFARANALCSRVTPTDIAIQLWRAGTMPLDRRCSCRRIPFKLHSQLSPYWTALIH